MRQWDHDRYLGVHKRLLGAAGIPRFRSRSSHRIQKCDYARTGSRRHDRARNQPFCAILIRPPYAVATKALPQTSWRGISGYLSHTAITGSEPTSPRCVKDQISFSIQARIFVQTADQVSPDNSPKILKTPARETSLSGASFRNARAATERIFGIIILLHQTH